MGTFLTAARRGQVKGPQQLGFSVAKWSAAYESSSRDEADQRLHASGFWYAEQFDKLRVRTSDGLKTFTLHGSQARLKAIVGYITREWLVIGRTVMKHMEQKR